MRKLIEDSLVVFREALDKYQHKKLVYIIMEICVLVEEMAIVQNIILDEQSSSLKLHEF